MQFLSIFIFFFTVYSYYMFNNTVFRLSHVVQPRVVFSADSTIHKLVANVFQFCAEEIGTLFVRLFCADFDVELAAYVIPCLVLLVLALVVLVPAAGAREQRCPFAFPVGPYVCHFVRGDECVSVVPVQSIAAQNVVGELGQDGRPLGVAREIRLQVV